MLVDLISDLISVFVLNLAIQVMCDRLVSMNIHMMPGWFT
jgi:hypothetical protein